MPTAGIVTIALVGVLLAALVVYLIVIASTLRTVIKTLGLVTFGVRSIAHQTEPVNPVLSEIKTDVLAIEGALTGLLEKKAKEAAEARP